MKNNSRILCFLAVMALFSLVLFACGSSQETDTAKDPSENSSNENTSQETDGQDIEPITLSFADIFPPTHEVAIQIADGWAKAVEEATDGLVKVEVYPGGTLLNESSMYEGLVSGVADVGAAAIGDNMGRFPLMSAMYVGGISYNNSKVASYVARDIVEEFSPEELEDTKFMFVYGLGPGDIASNKKVETLEDLQGLEIRASGNQLKTFELLGAIPLDIGMADAYEALSRGVVDAAVVPLEVLEGWNLAEVTKYITRVPFVYNAVHYVTMNRDVWDSLPAHIQEKIEEVNIRMFEEVAAPLFDEINGSALSYVQENFDHEIIDLSEEEQARWLKELEPLIDEYATELNSKGLPGDEVMERIQELADKYNKEFGQ